MPEAAHPVVVATCETSSEAESGFHVLEQRAPAKANANFLHS